MPTHVIVQFDRGIIKRNWRKINRGPMQRAGNIIRLNARESIRRVGNKHAYSRPGSPPFSRQRNAKIIRLKHQQ